MSREITLLSSLLVIGVIVLFGLLRLDREAILEQVELYMPRWLFYILLVTVVVIAFIFAGKLQASQ